MAMSAHALTHSLATRRPLSARRAAWAYKARSCRPAPCCSAAQGANGSSSGGGSPPADAAGAEAYQFTYKGSDGRLKATFEQAFKGYRRGSDDMGSASDSEADAPWALGYQMSEAGLMWNDQLKARLIKRVVADQLGVSEEEVEARLRQLQLLMPSLQQKVAGMRPQLLARLAANVPGVAVAMLQLKQIFPGADVSLLALREPGLVLGFDMDRLRAIAAELQALLPRVNIDKLVEENPGMLDVEQFKAALEEARRVVPGIDVQQALARDPQLIFGFQRGASLIPYDEPRPVSEEEADDEYSAYYSDSSS